MIPEIEECGIDIWEMGKENSCTKKSRILYQANLTAANIPSKVKKTRLTAIRVPIGCQFWR